MKTYKIRMTADWIVCGELWKKGKTYDAAQRERDILIELDKAKDITIKEEVDHA